MTIIKESPRQVDYILENKQMFSIQEEKTTGEICNNLFEIGHDSKQHSLSLKSSKNQYKETFINIKPSFVATDFRKRLWVFFNVLINFLKGVLK